MELPKQTSVGASLLEVVIAVGLVSVTLISLVSLSTKSVANSSSSIEKNQATRHTQETVEWIRRERDASWNSFIQRVQTNNTWCMMENNWSAPGACTGRKIPNTNFEREVQFDQPELDVVEVTVVTRWTDRSTQYESRSATILTRWQ